MNAYRCIYDMMKPTHPVFQDQASDMILDPPKQQPHEDLFNFFLFYNNYLKLHAYILGSTFDLTGEDKLNSFIS